MALNEQFCRSCGKKNISPAIAPESNIKKLAPVAIVGVLALGGLFFVWQSQRTLDNSKVTTQVATTQQTEITASSPSTTLATPAVTPQLVNPAQAQTIKEDRIGVIWNFSCDASTFRCSRGRNGSNGQIDFVGVVYQGKTVTRYQVSNAGAGLTCVFETEDGILISESFDDGQVWQPHSLIAPAMKLLDAKFSDGRDSSSIIRIAAQATQSDAQANFAVGDRVHIAIQHFRGTQEWKIMEKSRA